jgi:hypothetical protein
MKKHAQIIIWVIVLAVIIVLAATSGSSKEKDDFTNTEVTPVETQADASDVLPDIVNEEEIIVIEEDVAEVEAIQEITFMTPYSEGEFTFNFAGFSWELFDEKPGETKVNFRLVGFTRFIGGASANLKRPFGVGSYPGTCTEVTTLAFNGLSGDPLAFLECADGETLTELVAVQDTESNNLIHVMQRAAGTPEFSIARTLDMTQILK